MKKEVIIGCSSFNNRYWKGIFYPEELPVSKWFGYYAQHFDTYEMNGTFYKPPTLKVMENWYNKVPGDFLFSVKAPKEITHIKKMVGCEELLSDFYAICEKGLKEKLANILFQFPPSYTYQPERLQHIITALHPEFTNVVEFRHESWWIPEVWDMLSENNIVFCSVSYPNLSKRIFTDFPIVYIRLHGTPKLFYSEYSTEELISLKKTVNNADTPKKIFIYFNNTASTAGILNALKMMELQ